MVGLRVKEGGGGGSGGGGGGVLFFRAEDGIRDYDVTGVQTCALPIYEYFPIRKYSPSFFIRSLRYLLEFCTFDTRPKYDDRTVVVAALQIIGVNPRGIRSKQLDSTVGIAAFEVVGVDPWHILLHDCWEVTARYQSPRSSQTDLSC